MINKFDRLWERTQREIPGAKITLRTESKFIKFIFGVLTFLVKLFTLGYAEAEWGEFTTTILRTIYVPADFWAWTDDARYQLLRHELMHLRQARQWPIPACNRKGWWWVNAFLFSFCYLLVSPAIFTFRAKFEREGYLQSMLSWYECNGYVAFNRDFWVDYMAMLFGGSAYFFMWRKSAAKQWAIATIDGIERGQIKNDYDDVTKWLLQSVNLNASQR